MVENEEDLYGLAERLGRVLSEHRHRLVTAESCTGGWVSQCITDVPGSSSWFDRGFVTYSNEAKCEMLSVPEQVLDDHGAVSEQTVRAMATGALSHSQADCALAISGIAGPAGAVPGKPVGTVWLAWQRRDGECVTRLALLEGDRRAIRRQAVVLALQGLLVLYADH